MGYLTHDSLIFIVIQPHTLSQWWRDSYFETSSTSLYLGSRKNGHWCSPQEYPHSLGPSNYRYNILYCQTTPVQSEGKVQVSWTGNCFSSPTLGSRSYRVSHNKVYLINILISQSPDIAQRLFSTKNSCIDITF